MSINSISSSLYSLNQTGQVGSVSRTPGDAQAAAVQGDAPPPPPKGGGFGQAVIQSLSAALGIDSSSTGSTSATGGSSSATDGTTDSTNGQDVGQALGDFMHSLMTALHAQGGGPAGGSGGQGDGDGNGGRVHGHGHGGGRGKMEADLQSLVQSLGSSTSTSDTSSTDGSTSTSGDSTSSDSATSDLQNSFKNLLSALGASTDNSSATLNSFLQNLQSKMADVRPAGNTVNTTA